MGLVKCFNQGFLCSMGRVDLFQIEGARLVGLDSVKRPEDQAFHLQLIDIVQLCLNTYNEIKGE